MWWMASTTSVVKLSIKFGEISSPARPVGGEFGDRYKLQKFGFVLTDSFRRIMELLPESEYLWKLRDILCSFLPI